MDFIIPVFKPKGITSAQFLNILKTKIKEKKMGYAGTLDKLAEGLLVCATGGFTKMLNKISDSSKEYLAKIELGKESLTYDSEGPIKKITNDFPAIEKIKKILFSFPIGDYFLQKAPSFCAKKFKGRRLSDLARENCFIFKKSMVKIFNLKILNYNPPFLKVFLSVSSGFYVRSFAHEVGEKLGVGAYLKELKRLKINSFCLENAIFKKDIEDGTLEVRGVLKNVDVDLFKRKLNDKIKLKGKLKKDGFYFSLWGEFFLIKENLEKIKKELKILPQENYIFYLQKPKEY